MYDNVLTPEQLELLGFIRHFNKDYYLVGGTAMALQIGHRRSIDFDLFTLGPVRRLAIKKKVSEFDSNSTLLFEDTDQVHLIVAGVKLTFFSYPYEIDHPVRLYDVITMPNLLTLAAMKAYALGRRAKWKDYVDLYILLQDRLTLEAICIEADRLFGKAFSARLFRGQLAYHEDIDYSEAVDFMPGYAEDSASIRASLIEKSLENVIENEWPPAAIQTASWQNNVL